jgi:hypothetical protein
MSQHLFGWSYPPGCNGPPDDDIPPECEECPLDNEGKQCPYEKAEDYCYRLNMIEKCPVCDKEVHKVKGAIKEDCIATGYEVCYCCSPICAKTLQERIEKEFKLMEEHRQ